MLFSMDHVCKYSTDTFNSRWPDGSKSYGGYADYWRGKYSFVVKIPDEIPSDEAAPMLCGGITGKWLLPAVDWHANEYQLSTRWSSTMRVPTPELVLLVLEVSVTLVC